MISELVNGSRPTNVVACVLQRSDIRKWNNPKSQGELFSTVLADESGEIKAAFFGGTLSNTWETCKIGTSICVSGASVREADSRYNIANNCLELCVDLDKGGVVGVADYDVKGKASYRFTKIDQLGNAGVGALVDILGIVSSIDLPVDIRTKTGSTVRKSSVMVADQSDRKVSCEFWGEGAQTIYHQCAIGKIIAVKGGRITNFSGIAINASTAITSFEGDICGISDNALTNLHSWWAARSIQDSPIVSTKPVECSVAPQQIKIEVPIAVTRVIIRRGTNEKVFVLTDDQQNSQKHRLEPWQEEAASQLNTSVFNDSGACSSFMS